MTGVDTLLSGAEVPDRGYSAPRRFGERWNTLAMDMVIKLARSRFSTRWVLYAGFGGLLLLMVFGALDALQVFRQVQERNDAVRRMFLQRNRLLVQIRSDLYLSGTYLRDYLLEPDASFADRHRGMLEATRERMLDSMGQYEELLSGTDAREFRGLTTEVTAYWKVLEPVFTWDLEQRRQRSSSFLRDEVFPRRRGMLAIAGRVGDVNEQHLHAGNLELASLFTSFRLRLIVTSLATLGIGVLFALFCIRTVLRLEAESALRNAELQSLSASLVKAQEHERRAISRELHDEVGQSLSALLVELSNLSANLSTEAGSTLRGHLETMRRLAENSVGVIRNMALLLRPSMLDDFGLLPALEWHAREVSKRTGTRVDVNADGVAEDLPDDVRTCVYRVVQEALNNAVRHSRARTIHVSVRQTPGALALSVSDDGTGFDADRIKGLGLVGMQERASDLGGIFAIRSEPGRGTVVSMTLPLHGGTHSRLETGEFTVDVLSPTHKRSAGQETQSPPVQR
jgi:signal transduction histidine kinase